MTSASRVVLREEHQGLDSRYLDASVSPAGDLVLSGQDLGPSTAMASGDGEYEWWTRVRKEHLPALRRLLEISSTCDLLSELQTNWSGPRAGELEAVIREGSVPHETHTY